MNSQVDLIERIRILEARNRALQRRLLGDDARSERVDNAALRDAAARSGLSNYEIARRAGFSRPDSGKVRTLLGQAPAHGGNDRGRTYYRKTLSYDDAVALCRAIGADPVEVGL